MTDAYENENLRQEGQIDDNVGQDGSTTNEESSDKSWEEQAKYFQSEKDKLQKKNSSLKKYEKLAEMIQARPDIANTISAMVQGQQGQHQKPQRVELGEDEFDAWEAYNDPKSKSYMFRQQELQDNINQAVNQKMVGIEKQQGMQALETQLAKNGLNDQQIQSFMDFASKNPAEYGVDGAIKMWQAVMNNNPQAEEQPSLLDGVRETQNSPTPGGILQGQQPRVKDESQNRWEGVMKANNRIGNKIP